MVGVVPLQRAVDGTPQEAEQLAIDDSHALVGPAERAQVVLEEGLQGDDVVVHARDQLPPAPWLPGSASQCMPMNYQSTNI